MIVNKKNEIEVLKEVQKNTEMAMKAIETITPKVYDDGLALQLSRQALKYSAIHNKAVDGILEDRAMPYPANAVKDAMLTGGIHMNTMFDTSSSHIAELVIQGSNRGLTSMWKTLNQYGEASGKSMEVAKELMNFEEKSIEILKKYL